MIVIKFGGTSLRDATWIEQALSIVRERLDEAPVVVVSAFGDTTDRLNDIAIDARSGDDIQGRIDALRTFHHTAAHALLADAELENALTGIDTLTDDLQSLIQGVQLIHECSPRSKAAIISFGERLAVMLFAAAARQQGITTSLHDARRLIRTDDNYEAAVPIEPDTSDLLRDTIRPTPGAVHILPGFIAATDRQIGTILGRGGSDYSATIVGAALGCDRVEIWTDADGIMTSDPQLVPHAHTIPRLSYDEAAELSYFGTRIIHPYSIGPAVSNNIPILVRNTGAPDRAGTTIAGHRAPSDSPDAPTNTTDRGVRAIACRDDIMVMTIQSYRMTNAYGFLSRIFAVFERHRLSIDLVATSEVSISLTLDNDADVVQAAKELRQYGELEIERHQSIVCLVGKDLWKDSSTLARVFTTLTNIPIRMISLGSSDINLSLVVAKRYMKSATRALHDQFFRRKALRSDRPTKCYPNG